MDEKISYPWWLKLWVWYIVVLFVIGVISFLWDSYFFDTIWGVIAPPFFLLPSYSAVLIVSLISLLLILGLLVAEPIFSQEQNLTAGGIILLRLFFLVILLITPFIVGFVYVILFS